MPSNRRNQPLGVAVLCLLLGAAAIPAFARDSRRAQVKPVRVTASKASNVTDSVESGRENGAVSAVPPSARGDTSRGESGGVRVHLLAPGVVAAGVYPVPGGVDGSPFAFIGMVPFDAKRGEFIGTYHLGYWPAELHAVHSDAYENPEGFVEVTAANVDLRVSDHLTLGDFVTHDGVPFPKYIVLREALLDKIELVLQDLEMHGVATGHVKILSGFRTPTYNFALGDASGRARESRHQFGDAVDMIIDTNRPGHMDDLNHDGRVNVADVRVIEAAVDRVERAHPDLSGGLGLYREMGPSGPFAHIDVRGTRARWGTANRVMYASTVSRAGTYDRSEAVSTSHCEAEGASAILCQGFRHTH